MADGVFGKVLFVDLSRGTITEEALPPAVYRDVLGGYGLGVRLLYDRIPPGADPLGAENILGFVPGLLTGTGVPFGGRFMVVGKSPLTGGWGDANCGGHFGPALRSAGLDGLFVSGVSERPIILLIDGDRVELRDAGDLWGLDTVETERRIKEGMGRGTQVVSIGPAGENQSLIAAIMADGGRAAARSGLGAVMGSKGMKAVAVRGSRRPPIRDKDALTRLNRAYGEVFRRGTPPLSRLVFRFSKTLAPILRLLRIRLSGPSDAVIYLYRKYGTCGGTALSTEVGDAPVWTWRGVAARDFPLSRSARISDDAVIEHPVQGYRCRTCPVGCGGIVHIEGERYTVEEAHKPEYETLAAFGPLLLNDDLEAIVKINSLCDRYGLDTISTGATVAFAIECAENGLIEAELGDGLTLSWGNADAIVELVHLIAHRDGLGDLLAGGVRRAAERIGGGAEALAMHAGGQELPMHDSRYAPAVGLAYVVDPTPGRHNTANGGVFDTPALRAVLAARGVSLPGRYDYGHQGAPFALVNRYLQVVNCAGLCMFSLMMGQPPVREWINASTGWALSLEDLLRIGHRVQVLRHCFNLREGIRPDDVSLPARASGHPPLKKGPLRSVSLDMGAMRQDYYRAMGYNERGMATRELLESLGLSDIAEDLQVRNNASAPYGT
jgi:aldehyde:ferredoxin oxidoreductase